MDCFRPHFAQLRELQKNFRVQIYCGVNFFRDQNGIVIDVECLELFQTLNHPVDITVLCLGDGTE